MKHSNKDGTLSAESAEGRLRLKENALSPDTYPTQSETARYYATVYSSETNTRAVRPKPSPAVLQLILTAGISGVFRFSCMKFLGVSGVYDYAGLNWNSR